MMKCDYKVSIITVVYNGVRTIEKTIQSVIHQTYKDIEYIVIDGASTDGTQQIVEKYMNHISYYSSEKDEGLYHAMNKGIRKATGDIIGILNSDDWYTEKAIQDIVTYFRHNDVELVYGKIISVSMDNKEVIKWGTSLESIWYQMALLHPSVFVKKDVYDKFGVFNLKYSLAADYDLLLRFYAQNVRFGFIDEVITYFSEGGLSAKKAAEVYKQGYEISMSYVDRCPYKENVLPKIQETYNWLCFSLQLQISKGLIYKLLRLYFNRNIITLNIFGTGIWAERCYQNLLESEVEIICFSDNDMLKWDTMFEGIKVVSPQELKKIDVPILIAVREAGDTIKNQLQSMGIAKSDCVTIRELGQIFTKLTEKLGE